MTPDTYRFPRSIGDERELLPLLCSCSGDTRGPDSDIGSSSAYCSPPAAQCCPPHSWQISGRRSREAPLRVPGGACPFQRGLVSRPSHTAQSLATCFPNRLKQQSSSSSLSLRDSAL